MWRRRAGAGDSYAQSEAAILKFFYLLMRAFLKEAEQDRRPCLLRIPVGWLLSDWGLSHNLRKGNRALGVVQFTVQTLLSEEEVIRLPVVTLAF